MALSTDGTEKDKEAGGGGGGGQSGKKKKAKAMYEHVGRMNVRPFLEDNENDLGLGHVRKPLLACLRASSERNPCAQSQIVLDPVFSLRSKIWDAGQTWIVRAMRPQRGRVLPSLSGVSWG